MKRKFFFIAILLIVGAFIIAVVRYLSTRTPKQGMLKINSTPVASVFLDNKHVGRTPWEDKVAAGEITVKVIPETTIASLVAWQGKVTVAPNTLTYINRELSESELTSSGEVLWLEKITSRVSEIDVVTNPDGATIMFDDALKGVTPLSIPDITPADHTLTVTSPGFLTKTLKIKTTAGYKVKVAIQMAFNPGISQPTATPTGAAPSVTPVPTAITSPAASPSASPKVSPTKTPTPSVTPKATPTDPAKPFIKIKDTETGFLNVREQPGSGSKDVGDVFPGDKFTIIDTKDFGGVTWYQIKYDGTNLGWVSGKYAEKVE